VGSSFWVAKEKGGSLSGSSRDCLLSGDCIHALSILDPLQNHLFNMRQVQVQEEDIGLEAERRVKYKGTARIKLELLYFRQDESRELDRKHVEYLKQCFQKEGCRPLEVPHHIPAVIDQEQLDAAILASGISARDLLSNPPDGYPELVFPNKFQLECLHGRHRIQAAREFLSPRNKWWAVDLYLAGTNKASFKDLPRLTFAFVRYQPRFEKMFNRGIFQREEAHRWRDLSKDTRISFPTEHQL
jgi:hypothetical protein